ncbi:AfsR/SARP family transcriptional regulator [Nonomuraea lactucae]|uniref:AfsR/SARP family transcriptional regulator n=1 Tax=Nonomuraea lactucae TaxID=2249762 RepID=UPI000DE2BD63|nr:BTAD domain-containing putative transcriptional regulator [Nonomuraea lactucae]
MADIEIGILGPLRVKVNGQNVSVAAPKQRVLLALLASRANMTLSVDCLVQELWDEQAPSSARSTLYSLVSRLRKLLSGATPEVLVKQSLGYVLQIASQQVDANRFVALTTQARVLAADGLHGKAADLYEQCFLLVRGTPLADVPVTPMLAAEARRLEETWIQAFEEYLSVAIPLGRGGPSIGRLRALVSEHPYRERLWELLIEALSASGRRADALLAYQDARTKLAHDLGMDPGPILRRLQQEILVGDDQGRTDQPRYEPSGAVPWQVPPAIGDFTGRREEIDSVTSMLRQREQNTHLVICAIKGMAGVGKTTLAVQIAQLMKEDFPSGQLFVRLRGTEADPVNPAEVLARFLRALGVQGTAIPADVDERAELYRSLLAHRHMLIILDDAADETQIEPLMPGSTSSAVIVTSRARLTAMAGAKVFTLGVLPGKQARALIARAIGDSRVDAEPEAANELTRLCGNLPLALRVCAARLAARPHWSLASFVARLTDEKHRLRELRHGRLQVRASLELSYQALGQPARYLFHLLSLLDVDGYPAWLAAALSDIRVDRAEDLLDELVDVHLLEPVRNDLAGPTVRYRFHDLVRCHAGERMRLTMDVRVRRQVLERAFGAWLGLAEQAHRRLLGGDHMISHGDAPRWPLPRDLVNRLLLDPLAWFEAERLNLGRAIRQAAHVGLDELCWDLTVTSTGLYAVRGYYDDWELSHDIALEVVRRAGNHRGEACVLQQVAGLRVFQGEYGEALDLLQRADGIFRKVGDRRGLAMVLIGFAVTQRRLGRLDEALKLLLRAREDLAALDEPIVEAHVLRNVGQIYLKQMRSDLALTALEEALTIARAHSSMPILGHALYWLARTYLEMNDVDCARELLLQGLNTMRCSGDRRGVALVLHGLESLPHDPRGELWRSPR